VLRVAMLGEKGWHLDDEGWFTPLTSPSVAQSVTDVCMKA
jgi:hypothetical protein